MNYAEWIFGMMLKLAILPQEEPLQEPFLPLAPREERPSTPAAGELRFSYSSANPRLLDRLDLASWQGSAGDLLQAAVGWDSGDPLWLKLIRVGATGAGRLAVDFSAHEFGHLSSFSRAGARGMALGTEDQTADGWERPSVSNFLTGAFESSPTPISASVSDWERIDVLFAGKPREFAEFMVMTEAGGLNQEQIGLTALQIRSTLDVVPFLLAATSTLRYPVSAEHSDLAGYLARLDELGVRADATTIRLLSASRFLSGRGLALMAAFVQDLAGQGDGMVPLFSGLPEFESYLSRFGPTLKASVVLRWGELEIQPSYERSFAGGESTHEAGLKITLPAAPGVRLLAAAFAGDEGGRWLEAGVEARPLSWLILDVAGVSASGYTVHREVFGANLPMLEDREIGVRLTLGVAWNF